MSIVADWYQLGKQRVSLLRFVEYRPTSLEKNYRYDLLTESDLGVHIDLINPDTYTVGMSSKIPYNTTTLVMWDSLIFSELLDEADARLIEDEAATSSDNRRSQQHGRSVPWLRKTEYIAHDFTRYGSTTERNETKYETHCWINNENYFQRICFVKG